MFLLLLFSLVVLKRQHVQMAQNSKGIQNSKEYTLKFFCHSGLLDAKFFSPKN